MKILFSPVGSSDPVSEERDPQTGRITSIFEGSMLQICRAEQPQMVWLYINDAENGFAAKKQACVDALNALGGDLGADFEVQAIDRTESAGTNILSDFQQILSGIREDHQDAEILLNASSASPVMSTAIQVLEVSSGLDLKCVTAEPVEIPVPAELAGEPEQASEEAEEAAEVPEEAAEMTETANTEENTSESDTPAGEAASAEAVEDAAPAEPEVPAEPDHTAAVRENTVKMLHVLIDAYDYRGALAVGKAAGELIPQSFTGLLEAAILRSSGRIPDALQSFRAQGQQALMPGAGMIPEYYLMLDLYLKQQRYTDFMRALTPFMIEVFIAAIRKQFQHDVTQYMIYGSRKWDENKLVLTQMTGKFNETYTFHTKPKPGKAGGFVTTAHLSNFMENMSVAKSHSHLILDTLKLRQSAEDKLRNWANYTLQYASAEDFRRACALTAEELLAMLRNYVRNYTDIVLSDEFLASYDKINEKLKSML